MNGGKKADVIVVGAGLMGAATALALARRGRSVLVLDARRPGHREGSSHGSSRIFRRTYADPEHVRMTGQALELWRRLEAVAGSRILTMTGGIDHGAERGLADLRAALTAEAVPFDVVPAGVASERWPQFRFTGDALFHPEAGVIDPELAVAEMLRLATGRGAVVEHEVEALAVEAATSGVRVPTSAGVRWADVAVVAAGPWLPELLAGLAELPPLEVTKQQVFHFARGAGFAAAAGGREPEPWPVMLDQTELNAYALPGGRDGGAPGNMKLADHDPLETTTASSCDHRIDPGGRRRIVDYVRRSWPGLEPTPVAELTCLYTRTPDEDFVLDRVGPIVVCSPCSGHGAKFAPLVGEWAADLAGGAPPPEPRFALSGRWS